MNDLEAISSVVGGEPGTPEHYREAAFVNQLKLIWRERELEFIARHGRSPFCDCLMFQPGDYVEAFRRVSAL